MRENSVWTAKYTCVDGIFKLLTFKYIFGYLEDIIVSLGRLLLRFDDNIIARPCSLTNTLWKLLNSVFEKLTLLKFDIQKYRFIFFGQKKSFENFIFENYLYLFMSIYIDQLTQHLNIPNTFAWTAHPNNYLLTVKLEPLFAT